MKQIVFSPLPLSEFEILIEHSLRRVISEKSNSKQTTSEIIDRAELCKRLAITEPTVIRWQKKNLIPCFRIGSAVRYNWQAVLKALEGKQEAGQHA